MLGLFVTGTDTGVGKTVVTAAVARLLRQQGRRVRVCKPVATGAVQIGERWVSEDTARLAAAADEPSDMDRITPWRFAEPAAPPVAARQQGVALVLADIVHAVRGRVDPDAALLVEGVGGLLCPLTETDTVADLAAALDLPLVIVTRRSLGTLNHTLLTLEAAQRRHLSVAGVVVSETSAPCSLAEAANVDELRRRIDVPLLGVVSYRLDPFTEAPVELAGVDWWRLCHSSGQPV